MEKRAEEIGFAELVGKLGAFIQYSIRRSVQEFHPSIILRFNDRTLVVEYCLVLVDGKLQLSSDHVIDLPPMVEQEIFSLLSLSRLHLGFAP